MTDRDVAIDLVSACERSVLEEDAPGTHECWLVWGSSATGVIWNAPGVTSALLGTGAAHLVIDRVEVLGAVDGAAVEAHRLLARTPCRKLRLESTRPLGRAFRDLGLRDLGPLPLASVRLPPAALLLVPRAARRAAPTEPWKRGSFRAAALFSHLRAQHHSNRTAVPCLGSGVGGGGKFWFYFVGRLPSTWGSIHTS